MKITIDILKIVTLGLLFGTLININLFLREPFDIKGVGILYHVVPQQNNNNYEYKPETKDREDYNL